MKLEAGKTYMTKCGFKVEIYRTELTNIGQAIGAILIPVHPASCPGWQGAEWIDGRCLGRSDSKYDGWDIEQPTTQRSGSENSGSISRPSSGLV